VIAPSTVPLQLLHQFNILLLMHNYVYHRNKLPVIFSTYFEENKCIGDDTKAAARQSLNCIKNKKMAKNDFQYGRWNSYTLQCGTITTLISSGDCTLQCGMWLWNCDSEFTKWQHPAM